MIFMCVVHPLSFRRTQKENDFSPLPLTRKRDFLKVAGNSPILLFYNDFDVCSKFCPYDDCDALKFQPCTTQRILCEMSKWQFLENVENEFSGLWGFSLSCRYSAKLTECTTDIKSS